MKTILTLAAVTALFIGVGHLLVGNGNDCASDYTQVMEYANVTQSFNPDTAGSAFRPSAIAWATNRDSVIASWDAPIKALMANTGGLTVVDSIPSCDKPLVMPSSS